MFNRLVARHTKISYSGGRMPTGKKIIYLDHLSTTPVDPQVLARMIPYFTENFGNASSRTHALGWNAEAAVENARAQVATALEAAEKEVIFTSGATESNNLAILGVAQTYAAKGKHLITTAIEHPSVLDVFERLKNQHRFELTILGVDADGRVRPADLAAAIRPDTIFVSVIYANNETGVIQPIAELAKITREKGVIFHTDATQAVGKIPVRFHSEGVDLLSLSAHKLYGPKGVGALLVRKRSPRIRLSPICEGGGHENALRPGTLNVPGIVGLGEACQIATRVLAGESARLGKLRDYLWSELQKRVIALTRNGSAEHVLPHVLSLSICAVDAAALMMDLKDIAISSGSACSSHDDRPSYVLKAMGISDEMARSTVRISLGRFTTQQEIDTVISRMVEGIRALRSLRSESLDPETHGDEREFDQKFVLDSEGKLVLEGSL